FQDLVDRFLVVVLVGLVDVCKFTQVVAGGSLFFSRQLLLLLWARFVSAASPRAHDASSVSRVSVVVVRISNEWVRRVGRSRPATRLRESRTRGDHRVRQPEHETPL